eukprot:TRINITY_DN6166_c0_g1_i13.p1 TRINITY_DN6166_c0_g1~~TRINITY_DN6166_c0_g1_i13.p1  ORF type:complete len:241 (-),score=56.69 TRINITY_DN6166_c0_g1_i13:296-946(-)
MYEIEARLQEMVPTARITDQDLVNSEAKSDLIIRIGHQITNLEVLANLAEFADEFLSKSPTIQKNCLNQLIDQGLHLQQSKDDIVHFIDKVLQHSSDTSDTERVLDKCRQLDKELYVKLVCTTFAEQRYSEIGEMVKSLTALEDTTLTSLILAGLGAHLASTDLYIKMMEVAISEEIADKLVEQLKEAGFRAQACSLQLMALRIPGALRTMSSFKL